MKQLLLSVFIVCLCGCSTFNREWNAAAKAPVPANGIEGPWSGEWRSEKNGHHGSLRCVVTKGEEGSYRAHYRAKYMKILRFTYVATLSGRKTNGVVTLEGSADLGKLAGGVYTYEATATPAKFESTYSCKYDNGNYQMKRPAPGR